MSVAVASLGGIRSRISALEGRFDAERRDTFTVLGAEEFDAFGDVYQQALQAAQATAPAAAATPTPSVSFGSFGSGNYAALSNGATSFQQSGTITVADPSVANAINGVAGGGARPIGGYGSMPVPGDLRAFGNGQVPADRLAPISQNGHRLYAPAAAAWENVVSAAAADGFDMRITDSYRSFDEQVDLARRKGLYSNGGLAATPGTSNHGWGLAVDADLTDPKLLAWMRENGPRFGWVEAVPREPWHWEFRPHQV